MTSAAPPAAPVFRNSRRFTTEAVAMGHLKTNSERAVWKSYAAECALPSIEDAARWMALRMRWYVPQRQMLPLRASSMSASVGLGFLESSAAADMICPDWQYPHCGTSSSIQAFCTG